MPDYRLIQIFELLCIVYGNKNIETREPIHVRTLSLTSYRSNNCCKMDGATSGCSVTAPASAGAAAFLITSTSCTTSSKSALHNGSGTM